jgi:hypothetical protein
MPSQLNVDTLVAANGTDPVTLTKQSAAKAYARFTTNPGPTLDESFNVSSLSDNGTGRHSITFVNSMNTATYIPVSMERYYHAGQDSTDNTTSTSNVFAFYVTGTTGQRTAYESVETTVIHGDLA